MLLSAFINAALARMASSQSLRLSREAKRVSRLLPIITDGKKRRPLLGNKPHAHKRVFYCLSKLSAKRKIMQHAHVDLGLAVT
jgi:hypothetical protein